MKHMQLQITEHFITFKRFWCCGYRLDGTLVVVFSGARQLVWSGLDAGGQSSSPESSVAHLHREVLAGFILCLFFVFVFFVFWQGEEHGALRTMELCLPDSQRDLSLWLSRQVSIVGWPGSIFKACSYPQQFGWLSVNYIHAHMLILNKARGC